MMKARQSRGVRRHGRHTRPSARHLRCCTVALLLAVFPGAMEPQTAGAPVQPPQASEAAAQAAANHAGKTNGASQRGNAGTVAEKTAHPTGRARRHAAKEYLAASKLFLAGKFEQARLGFERAAALDPTNSNYRQAGLVARNHEVTELLQAAAKDRLLNNESGARAALLRAYDLEPTNLEVSEHLDQLGALTAQSQQPGLYGDVQSMLGGPVKVESASGTRSFHLRANERQVIEQVFKAFGIEALMDQSVGTSIVRFELGDSRFSEATRALGMATDSFYVPLDAHRVLVARNTTQNRQRFMRLSLETVYLPGLSKEAMTEVTNLARNVFHADSATPDATAGTLSVRAPQANLEAFNATMRGLLDGSSQVLLNVRVMQIAHTHGINTGVVPPQTITAFNVYTEEQAILNANQALVQQIISSGLAAPGDTLAILAILLASGQVSSPLLSNGFALFGGGITQSALSPAPASVNFALNSSDSRELDDIDLRLDDAQDGTLKLGTRYPIETSSFSSLSGSIPNIPGLTGAGNSGNLGSLLSQLSGNIPNIPQIQYQDLGLTLKMTPRVLRSGNVALSVDLKLDSLAGRSVNGLPVLNSRAFSGVIIARQGSATVLAGDLDESQSRALTGTPGLSELPGMNNVTGKDIQKNYATLLIVITPHVVRGMQAAGHSPMFRVVGIEPGR